MNLRCKLRFHPWKYDSKPEGGSQSSPHNNNFDSLHDKMWSYGLRTCRNCGLMEKSVWTLIMLSMGGFDFYRKWRRVETFEGYVELKNLASRHHHQEMNKLMKEQEKNQVLQNTRINEQQKALKDLHRKEKKQKNWRKPAS